MNLNINKYVCYSTTRKIKFDTSYTLKKNHEYEILNMIMDMKSFEISLIPENLQRKYFEKSNCVSK